MRKVVSSLGKGIRGFRSADHIPFGDLGNGFVDIYDRLVIELYIHAIYITYACTVCGCCIK